ncbi:MAG: DegT/DnrJ/EryC1/StrS family aminotransferase [Clostridia bacterium]|nr:DegT/DnrJ/EryC1/StrS family aminotransferase [Clostridia bacterium]
MIIPSDLKKLYAPIADEYTEAFRQTLLNGRFIGGEPLEDFEKIVAHFLGAKYAVGCASGTAALRLALSACGIGKGDEVITVANTYYATARAITDAGAEPVFCDVTEEGLIDCSKAESLITPKTKAILPVHLYGACADLDALRGICKRHSLALVEDCAHAFGSKYNGKMIGSGSLAACFSLYPTKNLGAFGDGGFIATDSQVIADAAGRLRYFAVDSERNEFDPDAIHGRLDTVQAALCSVSLRHVDEWIEKKRRNADEYIKAFKGRVPYITSLEQKGAAPYLFPVLTEDQDDFIGFMQQKGVLCLSHYRPELHKMKELTGRDYSLPVTEKLNKSVVSIPVSQTVTEEEIRYIIEQTLAYYGY